jgi:hypothetical protein
VRYRTDRTVCWRLKWCPPGTLMESVSTMPADARSRVSTLLELDVVVDVLENAFRPLMCTASISSDQQSVTFVVFDSNGAQILRRQRGLELRDPYSLRLTINEARAHLKAHGFKIDPSVPST